MTLVLSLVLAPCGFVSPKPLGAKTQDNIKVIINDVRNKISFNVSNLLYLNHATHKLC
jgi:hypothetical protein